MKSTRWAYNAMDEQNEQLNNEEVVMPGIENKPRARKPLEETSERNQRAVKEYNTQKRIYNALQATGDPMKLKEIIGAKTVAEVYRTLDKLTIRREFHDALTKAGITFEFLIEGIKREAIGGDKSMDRLKAYEMLLKTLGLDKYDDVNTSATSSWEERLLTAIKGHESVLEEDVTPAGIADYTVIAPQVPQSAQDRKKTSDEMEKSLGLHDGFPRAR